MDKTTFRLERKIKRLEQALEDSEKMLKERIFEMNQAKDELAKNLRIKTTTLNDLFDNIKEGVVIIDKEGVVKERNKATFLIFNQDVLNTDIRQQIRKEELVLFEKILTKFRDKTFRLEHKGEVSYYEFSATRIEEPEIDGDFRLVIRDVTHEVKVKKELQIANIKLKQLFDYAPIPMIFTDKEDKIIKINQYFSEMSGYNLAQVNESNFIDLIKNIDQKYQKSNSYLDVQEKIKHKEGQDLVTNSRFVKIFNQDDEFVHYVGTIEDVTTKIRDKIELEQRQKAEKFIAKTAYLFSKVTRDNFDYKVRNTLLELAEFIGSNFVYLFDIDDQNNKVIDTFKMHEIYPNIFKNLDANYFKTKDVVFIEDEMLFMEVDSLKESSLKSFLKDKKIKSTCNVSISIGNDLRSIIGLEGLEEQKTKELYILLKMIGSMMKTASERLILDNKKNIALSELKIANEDLKDFAHIISHDLKSPLGGIHSLTDIILEDYKSHLGKEVTENLLLIKDRIKRMVRLITDILAYSSSSNEDLPKQKNNLNYIIEEEVLKILPKPVHVKVMIMPNFPSMISNKSQLNHLFMNLISNAFKYAKKPQGLVEIGYVKNKNTYRFYVSDNGKGIAEHNKKDVFKIFNKLDEKSENSTGIGLSIVKKVINTYGGEIEIESTLGKGTKFSFSFDKKYFKNE